MFLNVVQKVVLKKTYIINIILQKSLKKINITYYF